MSELYITTGNAIAFSLAAFKQHLTNGGRCHIVDAGLWDVECLLVSAVTLRSLVMSHICCTFVTHMSLTATSNHGILFFSLSFGRKNSHFSKSLVTFPDVFQVQSFAFGLLYMPTLSKRFIVSNALLQFVIEHVHLFKVYTHTIGMHQYLLRGKSSSLLSLFDLPMAVMVFHCWTEGHGIKLPPKLLHVKAGKMLEASRCLHFSKH